MLSNSFASEVTDIKNLVINKELKSYSDITFLDSKDKELNLNIFMIIRSDYSQNRTNGSY